MSFHTPKNRYVNFYRRLEAGITGPPAGHVWSFEDLAWYAMQNGGAACVGFLLGLAKTTYLEERNDLIEAHKIRMKRKLTNEDRLAIWFVTGIKPPEEPTNPTEP